MPFVMGKVKEKNPGEKSSAKNKSPEKKPSRNLQLIQNDLS